MTGPNCPGCKIPNSNLTSNAGGHSTVTSKKITSRHLPRQRPSKIKPSYSTKRIIIITLRVRKCEHRKWPNTTRSNKI